MAKKKSLLEQIASVLDKAGKLLKGPHKVASGAVVAAALGGLLKLAAITETFPHPTNILANLVVFFAVLFFVVDVARGGLYD